MQGENSQLDNFTDALMLLTAAHPSEKSSFISAIDIDCYKEPGVKSVDTLLEVYQNHSTDVAKESYGRYWHGYLIFLKPLLTFLNYGEIRSVLMFVQLALMIAVLLEVSKKKSTLLFPVFAMWIFLNPVSMMLSVQYNTVLLLTLLAIYTMLKVEQYWGIEQIYEWSLLFLIVGMLTSYFDLLTYPLLTLGIPLVSWLAIYLSEKKVVNVYSIIRFSLFWGLGYGGMWSFKWILGSIITGENLFANALNSVAERTSGDVSNTTITFVNVLKKQSLDLCVVREVLDYSEAFKFEDGQDLVVTSEQEYTIELNIDIDLNNLTALPCRGSP